VKLDPDVAGKMWMAAIQDFYNYFNAKTRERRAQPTDDLMSLIANSRIDGELIADSFRQRLVHRDSHRRPRHHVELSLRLRLRNDPVARATCQGKGRPGSHPQTRRGERSLDITG